MSTRQIQVDHPANITAAASEKNYLCKALSNLLNCPATISVTAVQIPAGFDCYNAPNLPNPTANGLLILMGYSTNFTIVQPKSQMSVQAVVQSPSLVGGLIPGFAYATASGLAHVTISSAAFINE